MKALQIKYSVILALLLLMATPFLRAENSATKGYVNMNLEQASELIRKQSRGKVLSATTTVKNGTRTHRIQVLNATGRIKVHYIPAHKQDNHSNYDTDTNFYPPNNNPNIKGFKPNDSNQIEYYNRKQLNRIKKKAVRNSQHHSNTSRSTRSQRNTTSHARTKSQQNTDKNK